MVESRRPFGAVALLGVLAACGGRVVPPAVPAIAPAELTTSIFLLGDAGSSSDDDVVLAELTRQTTAAPRASAIVFLGDNVYPRGMVKPDDPGRAEAEKRLDRQIAVAQKSGLHAYFIPGNHDWFRMGQEGWDAVRRSEIYIRERAGNLARQAPRLGCPGPDVVDVGSSIRLVLLDTQWWLQRPDFPKARDSVSTCVEYSEETVVRRLAAVLADSTSNRKVIVAGHNPLATKGEHGGYFSLKTHLFPLTAFKRWLWIPFPLLGSLYPVARSEGLFGYSQDLNARANRHMRQQLARAMAPHPPMLYAAGHDHNMQVLRGPVAKYTIVSGVGMDHHSSSVGWMRNTLFASQGPGFMRVDVDRRGRARLSVYDHDLDGWHEKLAIWLTEP
ncbi:MAG TPA: metallophosphoesterase [Gemmatimonadales bacterium]|nr:metallophosphoesterase [Gemmatimonadales bacterium]